MSPSFIIKIAAVEKTTTLPAWHPCRVPHDNERMKMTDTPVPNSKVTGQTGPRWLKEASGVAFRKLPVGKPPPEEVAGRIKRWLTSGLKFSPLSDLHWKSTDFCNPGNRLGTCVLSQERADFCAEKWPSWSRGGRAQEVTNSSCSTAP